MSYKEAMEADGAKVLAYESFGDWQGTWWAKVEYAGVTGWVQGSYGYCSSCDAFEAEFCDSYGEAPEKERLALFGRSYLQHMMTSDEAIWFVSKRIEEDWVYDDIEKQLDFLKEHSK